MNLSRLNPAVKLLLITTCLLILVSAILTVIASANEMQAQRNLSTLHSLIEYGDKITIQISPFIVFLAVFWFGLTFFVLFSRR